ncbi:hypothetical protein VNO80_24003 [Phaseolus coccineus]|uniref:Uncharacterized protein n=1 Tax=Phaseolus coccineus TaxID=3886 RepID=A0AAN9LV88_PHACN
MGLKKEENEDDDKEMRGTRTQWNGNDEGKSGNSSWSFKNGSRVGLNHGNTENRGLSSELKFERLSLIPIHDGGVRNHNLHRPNCNCRRRSTFLKRR